MGSEEGLGMGASVGSAARGQKGEASQAHEDENLQSWTVWKSCW